jgi:hypothetical protein
MGSGKRSSEGPENPTEVPGTARPAAGREREPDSQGGAEGRQQNPHDSSAPRPDTGGEGREGES